MMEWAADDSPLVVVHGEDMAVIDVSRAIAIQLSATFVETPNAKQRAGAYSPRRGARL